MRRIHIEERVAWHVVLRGSRRLQIFHERQDYEVFLAFLRESCAEKQVDSAAFALLSNHGHLGLFADSERLAACMRRLNRAYSGYHNRKYGLSGHTFEDKYFAKPVLTEFGIRRLARYIHLNPVRAGLAERPENYAWSDYPNLISDQHSPCAPASHEILALFSEFPARRVAEYVRFVEADLNRPRKFTPAPSPAIEVWQEQFLWILERAESCRDKLGGLSTERAAVYAAVRAGIPPKAIGRALGKKNGLAASQAAYRVKRYLADRHSLREAVDSLGIL